MKYCPKCSNEFEDWAGECPECGLVLVYDMPFGERSGLDPGARTAVVYRSNKQRDIEIAKNLLEGSGIKCAVKGLDSAFPIVSYLFGMKVLVDEKDREEAEKALINLKRQG
jgi:hypothetical protein